MHPVGVHLSSTLLTCVVRRRGVKVSNYQLYFLHHYTFLMRFKPLPDLAGRNNNVDRYPPAAGRRLQAG